MVSLDDVIDSLEAVADRHGMISSDAAAQAGRTLLAALAHRECEGSRTAAAGILSNMRSVDHRSRLFRAVVSVLGSLDEPCDPRLLEALSSHQRPLLEALSTAAANPDPDLDRDGLFETIAASGVIAAALELSEESSDGSALLFLNVIEPLIARLGERVKGFGLRLDADPADIDSRNVGLRLILDCAALLIVRRLALAAGGGGGRRQDDGDGPRAHDLLAAEDLAATARPGDCYELGCRVLRALIAEIQGREAEYPS